MSIKFSTFPRTEPPPEFAAEIVNSFRVHEAKIKTEEQATGLKSDEVLSILAPDLISIGFEVETSKKEEDKIGRPVFFGENGLPTLRYEVDGYNSQWRCGIEIEAGRALMGNAIYRNLIQASVMVGVDTLCLAVCNAYRYKSAGKVLISKDYEKTVQVAEVLYSQSRLRLPYKLIVVGY